MTIKCDICDREDSLISYDIQTKKFSPCTVCQEAINECLDGYGAEDTEDDWMDINGF